MHADPPRLATTSGIKKARGPSCLLLVLVCACANVHLAQMHVGTRAAAAISTRLPDCQQDCQISNCTSCENWVHAVMDASVVKYDQRSPTTHSSPLARLPQSCSMHGALTSPCIYRRGGSRFGRKSSVWMRSQSLIAIVLYVPTVAAILHMNT